MVDVCHFYSTKDPSNGIKQRITERTNNQGENFAQALQFNEVPSKAWHDTPDVIKA